ncbi:MAG TPA: patatin-like phospholipase family protein [Mycobacteriales bacterium]|nr:patatin-like phospholipase family protein [Mycobacteriales bacterium]
MSLLPFRAPRGAAVEPRPVAIVLSGGGSAGAAQAGMLAALMAGGTRPDFIVGCSVGALNGTFLAIDPTAGRAAALVELWRGLTPRDVFGSSAVRRVVNLLTRRDHLCSPDALRRLVRSWMPIADLADTEIPMHVITTDLHTGQPAWWSAGDTETLLAASACLPGVFPPVALGGSRHVDGGVSDAVPVERAVELGARTIWLLDVTSDDPLPVGRRMSALDVLLRSFTISRTARRANGTVAHEGVTVHHLRVPACAGLDPRDFSRSAALLDAGYTTAKAFVDALAAVPVPEQRSRLRRRLRPVPAA